MKTKFLSKNLKGRVHSEDLGIEGKIILERILGRYGGRVWSGYGSVADPCEHGNEPSASIKGEEFLD
jgi:hypothetical protein